ncbi:MAG: glutamate--tRNA ligase family protein, partial [Pirellulaceae bacterium]|nr:glutamate--tRNA ligase family protein [Pirellulaceae bacterium]
ILRIDDTDQQRNVETALQPILDGFRWLGIDWDEGPQVGGDRGPYFQSQRSERYQQAVDQLLSSGHAYRDYSTSEEVQQEREQAQQEKIPFLYSRRWMAETDEQAAGYEAEGRQAVVRLKMPRQGTCQIDDLVRGQVEFAWESEQDMVIQKADGSCLYHLASVVDDHDFEISHVIRAEEHLSNTPRQIFIIESLGYPRPAYAHLPYVAEPGSKNKLSKRKIDKYLKNPDFRKLYERGEEIALRAGRQVSADTFNPVLVDFYRDIGFLPHAIVNYLLLLGWSLDDHTEQFTIEEMVEHFSLQRVVKSPASFDPAKLLAFQQREMDGLPPKQKVAMVLPYLQQAGLVSEPPPCETGPFLGSIVEAAADRITMAGDILQFDDFFTAEEELQYDQKALEKRITKPAEAIGLLAQFRQELAGLESFTAELIEAAMRSFVEERELKFGQLIHPVRVAVTGKPVGFGLFETLAILGQARSLERIDQVLQRHAGSET